MAPITARGVMGAASSATSEHGYAGGYGRRLARHAAHAYQCSDVALEAVGGELLPEQPMELLVIKRAPS